MNTHRFTLTLEHFLYLALFGLALFLRLYHLNDHPLAEAEAREALLAYRLIQGSVGTGLPYSPAYFSLAYLSFLLFGASEAIARLAPAVAGSMLVFLPTFFADKLGRGGALGVGLGLALSTTLVAASRSADGAVLALCGLGFGVAALRVYLRTDSALALMASGLALGLGVTAGPMFLTGLLALALTELVAGWVNADAREARAEQWSQLAAQARPFLITLAVTTVLIATTASVYRFGLGALAASWAEWARGFLPAVEGRSPQTLLVFLLTYEPLLVIGGLFGAGRAFRNGHRPAQWLVWFTLAALAVVIGRGSRAPIDLIWVVAPLAALGGWAVFEVGAARWARTEQHLVAAQVGISSLLLVFAGLLLVKLAEQMRTNPDPAQIVFSIGTVSAPMGIYLFLAIFVLALVPVTALLMGAGWSPRAAYLGLMVGCGAALLGMNLSALWGLTQLRPADPVELWQAHPTAPDVRQLVTILENTSNYAVGNAYDMDVTVQAPSDGALAWALRRFPHAVFVEALSANVNTRAVISPRDPTKPAAEQTPPLGSTYMGQAFTLRQALMTIPETWPDQLNWYLFRRASVGTERVILWVRQDVQQLKTANGR